MNDPQAVLTAEEMRTAEQRLIDDGVSVDELMLRAGQGAAEWVWRMAAGRSVTVLCGPGNNGGDGYVVAEVLRRRGLLVTVMAPLAPKSAAARDAAARYQGPVGLEARGDVMVDCLFGTGLRKPLSHELEELLSNLLRTHSFSIAIDLPSGMSSDTGELLNGDLPSYDLTLALGAWKPAHWLMPGMAKMGERRLVPIDLGEQPSPAALSRKPAFRVPLADAHKYARGLVAVVGGAMPGAAVLASQAAMRAGAGYTKLLAEKAAIEVPPDLVIGSGNLVLSLADERINAVLVGCGLGRDGDARARLEAALASGHPLVLDADALMLLTPQHVRERAAPIILTPHAGELAQLCRAFAVSELGKVQQAQALARASGTVVLAKGPDNVLADSERVRFFPPSTSWLSIAGTGDVLAGVVASRLACTGDPFRAAEEAVWLHGEAARLCLPPFTASDLASAITVAYGSFF